MSKLDELQKKLEYPFQDRKLLKQAMTHSSYSNEHRISRLFNNERLEFLGDAVLELVTSEFLYGKYPDLPEGDLTKMRASIVCESTLAYCAGDLNLGSYLLLGKGEESTGGRNRSSIVSDAMEALIGSIYLDGGFANAKEFIHKYILTDVENKQLFYDSKTILQEIIQGAYKEPLSYELMREEGPDHNKVFEVCAKVGERVIGTGTGRTKKSAEQLAAYRGILTIKKEKNEGESTSRALS